MKLAKTWTAIAVGAALLLDAAQAADYLVRDQQEYRKAVRALKPGDSVVLADGEWRDFDIVFEARGEKEAPVLLRPQTPGGVVIAGQSSLRLAGEHLIVRDLIFRDGYSPRGEVISFRKDSKSLANNSRLANVVVDGFSKPDREAEDHWVALYGKNNVVDHNYFAGKTNRGPTLVVRLNTPESRENRHRIVYNHFGPRPPLGGNGGETIRVGVSDYSREQSRTLIARNYFERCDGEVEIISIKSEGNTVAENVFYESRGSVVLRHGGGNVIERNVFLGNGVADTGGIRVINENQTVRGNYLEGLRGAKFLSAIAVMNGVPNSPENRYHQVKNAWIENNSFIDVSALGFAVGSDEERSAIPQGSTFRNNLLVIDGDEPVAVFDDISGIAFEGNVASNPKLADFGAEIRDGLQLIRAENGLLYPEDEALAGVGAPRDLRPIKREETGPGWFERAPAAAGDEVRKIDADGEALRLAVADAEEGAVLKLAAGLYETDKALTISRMLTIEGEGDETVLRAAGSALFEMKAGGALRLKNVRIELIGDARAVASATGEAYAGVYELSLESVALDASDAKKAQFLTAEPATFAKSISLADVTAYGFANGFIALPASSKNGWYLADEIRIRDSLFENVAGPLVEYGRLGGDESTFGPRFIMTGSTLSNVGAESVSLALEGVDTVDVSGNRFKHSGVAHIRQRVSGAPFLVTNNVLEETPALIAEPHSAGKGKAQ
jgi:poly(beta-D-mannuronate) lyase